MFEKATRKRTALWIAISSPSGAGKTFSALRLARGIQRLCPGPIRGIDTEHGRMSHYAGAFDFDVLEMQAPYRSLSYLELITAAVTGLRPNGSRYGLPASSVIIDSMSHEHSGPGGYLDFQHEETKRLMKEWRKDEPEAVGFAAYAQPAQERRSMIDGLVHLGACNLLFCFRSKHSAKKDARKVVDQGWIPVGSEELWYEMGIRFLLPPGADGRPDWDPDKPGEKEAIKRPDWARDIDLSLLTEDVGEELALWALGDDAREATQRREQAAAYDEERKRLLGAIRSAMKSRGLSMKTDPDTLVAESMRCFGCHPGNLASVENEALADGLEKLRNPPAATIEPAIPDSEIMSLVATIAKATSVDGLRSLAEIERSMREEMTSAQRDLVGAAFDAARARIEKEGSIS